MLKQNVKLLPLQPDDREQFILDNQVAFNIPTPTTRMPADTTLTNSSLRECSDLKSAYK